MSRLLDYLSSWYGAKRSVSIYSRFITKSSSKVKGIKGKVVEENRVMVKELHVAEKVLQQYIKGRI